jgi:hypothetical protein
MTDKLPMLVVSVAYERKSENSCMATILFAGEMRETDDPETTTMDAAKNAFNSVRAHKPLVTKAVVDCELLLVMDAASAGAMIVHLQSLAPEVVWKCPKPEAVASWSMGHAK